MLQLVAFFETETLRKEFKKGTEAKQEIVVDKDLLHPYKNK